MEFKEIIYEKKNGVAKVIINRPERLNAFTLLTMQEMIFAFQDAWADKGVGVVVLTGSGDKAFCTGGDIVDMKSKEGSEKSQEDVKMDSLQLHSMFIHIIRAIPKPVIAMVNGYAIGGGHVFQVVCDLSIASDKAVFGQAGPKVGSFDAGYGTVFLARIVGEKKAREIWYMCKQYSAQEALEMGLINKIVPHNELEAEVDTWCKELLKMAPSALGFLKASFNADTQHVMGIDDLSFKALNLYYESDEAKEGVNAFKEKRPPDFSKFRK